MTNMINTVSASVQQEINKVLEQPKEENKVCEYCGSTIPADSTKCDSCGAKVKK